MIYLDDKKHAELMMHIGALIDMAERVKAPEAKEVPVIREKIEQILIPIKK